MAGFAALPIFDSPRRHGIIRPPPCTSERCLSRRGSANFRRNWRSEADAQWSRLAEADAQWAGRTWILMSPPLALERSGATPATRLMSERLLSCEETRGRSGDPWPH